MTAGRAALRPLPVVLPALRDELLSSWLSRHAVFYGVYGGQLLRRCGVNAPSLRHLDLCLSRNNVHRLAATFRCDPTTIRRMTQLPSGRRPDGLIATVRPMQFCGRCIVRHRAVEVTRGARLRSWMEGWRLSCPVCGGRLKDARPIDVLTKVDADDPFLASVADLARRGERLVDAVIGKAGPAGVLITALLRLLLAPREATSEDRQDRSTIPRLLDAVVPGFDAHLRQHHPGFHRPGTLLLPISIRVPVLAGASIVAARPDAWADPLRNAAGKVVASHVDTCLRSLLHIDIRRAFSSIATTPRFGTGVPLGGTGAHQSSQKLLH